MLGSMDFSILIFKKKKTNSNTKGNRPWGKDVHKTSKKFL